MSDVSFGGLADSVVQAFMFDKQLLEIRRVRQQTRVSAGTARQKAREARQSRRATQEARKAMRAETATVKSKASQERFTVREQARAEALRVAQERSRKEKETQRLLQMRVATRQETAQQQTARAGQRHDTAETRRGVAQSVNEKMLLDAEADPLRVVTRAGAPIQAAAKLNPESEATVGYEPKANGPLPKATSLQAGATLFALTAGMLVGALWMDRENGDV